MFTEQAPNIVQWTCLARLHTLFSVVGTCWMLLGEHWNCSKQAPNISFVSRSTKRGSTLLDAFAQNTQQCWAHACVLWQRIHGDFSQNIKTHRQLWCSTRYLFISEIFPDAGNVCHASFRENARQSFENYRLCLEKHSFQTWFSSPFFRILYCNSDIR